MTNQEMKLGVMIEDAIIKFIQEEDGCPCNGHLMAVNREVKDLIAKTLDAKVHGGTLRSAP